MKVPILPTKKRHFFTSTLLFIFLVNFSVNAQFEGDFAAENWVFTTDNADGAINLSGAPDEIVISGGNDNQMGNTDFTITIPTTGDIKFSWSFFSTDVDGASYDPAGYVLNGIFTPLVNDAGPPDQSGNFSITVTAGDIFAFRVQTTDGAFGPGILTVNNFSPYKNTTPTLDPLIDLYLAINEAPFDINLTGITAGISETGQIVSVNATSSDPAIIPHPTVTYTDPNTTGTINIAPVTDAFGDVQITVTVQDDGGTANGAIDTFSQTFNVSINSNFPPTIASIPNYNLSINSPQQVINLSNITPGANPAEMQVLIVSAVSSNQAVVADEDIIVDYLSPLDYGTLSFTTKTDAVGQSTISVTVMDDGGTANGGVDMTTVNFSVKVNANQSPWLNEIADLFLPGNAPEQDIFIDGIVDGDNGSQILSVVATSDNTDLIPNPVVTHTNPDEDGMLTFTPVSDQFGTANITVTVMDDGGTTAGGIDTFSQTFQITVSSNYTPTLDEIQDVVRPIDNGLFSVNLGGISAGSGETQNLTVTAVSDNPTLIPDPLVNYISDNATGSLDLDPTAALSGIANITVTVMDDGGTDNGSIDNISRTFKVTITGNEPPTIDLISEITIVENSGEQTIDFSNVTAGGAEVQNLVITIETDDTDLITLSDPVYTSPDLTGSFAFTPVADQSGQATIFVTVMDDGGTNNDGIDATTVGLMVTVLQSSSYSSSLSDDTSFDRPIDGIPPPSAFNGVYYFHAQPFVVDQSGDYRLFASNVNFNSAFALYEENFDPNNSLGSVLHANDDDPDGDLGIFPVIEQSLVAGRQYILVTTSSAEMVLGNFTNTIIGPGEANFGVIPTLDFIEDVAFEEDNSFPVNLSGITDGNSGTSGITISVESNEAEAFMSMDITQDEATATAIITLVPNENYNGETNITVTVNNGNVSFDRSFIATISPVNDPPSFAFDPASATANNDETAVVVITIVPDNVPDDEVDQEVTYTLDPTTVDFATVTFDPVAGTISFSDYEKESGEQEFTVTADDGQAENNTFIETFTFTVVDVVGISDEKLLRSTKVSPNPSSGIFNIEITSPEASVYQLSIYDIAGRMISSREISGFTKQLNTSIDLSNQNNGLYIIHLKGNDGKEISKRVIKE